VAWIKPRAIGEVDAIAIVSPASPIQESKLRAGLEALAVTGMKFQLAEHILSEDGYLAGPDEIRALDLNKAIANPFIRGLYASRGGYGCARLLNEIDFDGLVAERKLFAGFSDLTTLHLELQSRHFVSLYAPMVLSFSIPRAPWVLESFVRAFGGLNPLEVEYPPGTCLKPGVSEGRILGGCLCLVCDSIGVSDIWNESGYILLLEDVDEPPHRVDAMLTYLWNIGILQRASGVVVGEMTRTDEKADNLIGAKPWRGIVEERLEKLGCPVIIDFPFGHAPNMLTVPLGVKARLDAGTGRLTLLESVCES